MSHAHANLAAGRWQTLSLMEQLANVGSDEARAHHWQGKDASLSEKAFIRALELLDLTIGECPLEKPQERTDKGARVPL